MQSNSVTHWTRNHASALVTAVKDDLRLNDPRSGAITLHTSQEHLDKHQEEVKETIHNALDGSHINTCQRNGTARATFKKWQIDVWGWAEMKVNW
jgi:hypothetical protein